jgi:hypothetical protein
LTPSLIGEKSVGRSFMIDTLRAQRVPSGVP